MSSKVFRATVEQRREVVNPNKDKWLEKQQEEEEWVTIKPKNKQIKKIKSMPDRSFGLQFKETVTEAEIQAMLYAELTKQGYWVKLEQTYCVVNEHKKANKYKGRIYARFDLLVFDDTGYGQVIVEIKTKGNKVTDAQRNKYKKFDAEFLECIGEDEIDQTIDRIKEIMDEC